MERLMKSCPRCKQALPVAAFAPNKARRDGRTPYCRVCHNEYRKARVAQTRLAALERLGGACAHCGISDPRVLAIDHVDGYGGRMRRETTIRQGTLYRHVLYHSEGFQVLCWNCNWIKRLEADPCALVPEATDITIG